MTTATAAHVTTAMLNTAATTAYALAAREALADVTAGDDRAAHEATISEYRAVLAALGVTWAHLTPPPSDPDDVEPEEPATADDDVEPEDDDAEEPTE